MCNGKKNSVSRSGYAAVRERPGEVAGSFRERACDNVRLNHVAGRSRQRSSRRGQSGLNLEADSNSAVLAVWSGKNPVTETLKEDMVGVDKQ